MKAFSLLVVFFVSVNVYASGQVTSSEIYRVRVDQTGKGYVEFKKNLSSSPACAQHVNRLAFDANTEGGKAIYSLMLTAFAANKKITAYGNGTCKTYPSLIEEYSWGYMQ
jgi:hypothetical protein